MKIAVIGSRSLTVVDLAQYLPIGVTEMFLAVHVALIPPRESMPMRMDCLAWNSCQTMRNMGAVRRSGATYRLSNMPIWYSRFGTENHEGQPM